ncbi:MAG: PQQ-binding-like beta-propeller repeat protein [Geodermatophilaceae bacterium]|nr:PQQ-binding-like beta-propeller repeat protein [Geodermatophilaceae bacterium]
MKVRFRAVPLAALTAALLTVAVAVPAEASAPEDALWMAQETSPRYGNGYPDAMGLDPRTGRIHVAGYALRGNEFENYDYVTVSYDSQGARIRTRTSSIANTPDFLQDVAVDPSSGSYFVTGYCCNVVKAHTVAYGRSGNVLWDVIYEDPTQIGSYGYSVAVDPVRDRVYLGVRGSGSPDKATVVALSKATGEQLWTSSVDFDYGSLPTGLGWPQVAVHPGTGTVVLSTQNLGALGSIDIEAAAFDSSGQSLWNSRYDGPRSEDDGSEDVIIVGDTIYVVGNSDRDIATVTYDLDGNQKWAATYGLASRTDFGADIAVDPVTGAVLVTGRTYLQGGGRRGDPTVLTLAYDSLGGQLWTALSEVGSGVAVAVDATRGVAYVAGDTRQEWTTIAYAIADGTVLRTDILDEPTANLRGAPADIAVDSRNGNVYLTGNYPSPNDVQVITFTTLGYPPAG